MKKLLLTLASCLLVLSATAQSSSADSLGDYEARFTKLHKAYAKSPNDVETLFNLAHFYFDNSNPMRNLPMAMKYIQSTEKQHIRLIEADKTGELTRLVRNGITLITIRQTKQSIIDEAYHVIEYRTDMTDAELNSYMDAFGIDMDLVRLLRQRRINQVYEECLRQATPESYYRFINNYPGTSEAEQMEERLARLAPGLFEGVTRETAIDSVATLYTLSPSVQRAANKQRSRMAYASAITKNDVDSYNEFLKRFPTSDESDQARERLESLLDISYARCKTAMEYAVFANTYSDIPLADKALEECRRLMFATHDIPAARYYLQNFKLDPFYNEVYSRFYSWHAAEGNGDPLRRFVKEYPDFPNQRVVESDLEKAKVIDRTGLMVDFLELEYPTYSDYVRRFMGKGIAFVPLQRMIQVMLTTKNYQAALERVRKFSLCFENSSKKEYLELQRILAEGSKGRHITRELATTYHIIHPSVNEADGNLYFTRAGGTSLRICYAVRQGSQWKTMGDVQFEGSIFNDGLTLFGFYAQGTRMLFGSEGNIYMAEKEGDKWRITDNPPYPVNTDYLETDAYMLPDGSGMLLASDRPGGHNLQSSGAYFHGDTAVATDIYFVPFVNGTWGTPVNLGPKINTPYSERCPILSRNLKTLYFTTDARGLGYGDIYEATRTDIKDWTSWSEPVNVGKEINTGFSETGISFGPDEKRIYFSANTNLGSYACFSFPTWHDASNPYLTYSLDILGMESSLIRVRVADLTTQSVSQVIDCSGESNVININIHKDKRYAIMGDAGLYFVPAVIVNAKSKNRQRLMGYTFPVLVSQERPMTLQAVDFEDASAELLPVAQIQLEQLAKFLNHHPKGIVEFCINVADSDDARAYNLSLERGRTIRSFMALNGIDASRVIISAYGNVNLKRNAPSSVAVRFRE